MTMDRLWPKTMAGVAPLLVWAAHFTFCYLFAAALCTPGRGRDWRWWVLCGVTVVALGAVAWLLRRAWRRGWQNLLAQARLGSAVLALVGIAWASLPLLAAGRCA